MRVWNTITPVLSLFLHFIHPSLSLALSPPLMASGEVCDGSSCWNIYWSVFLSFIYFPLFPLALPSRLHRPRNTSSTLRCQRRQRGWKSTTWNHYLAFVAPSSFTCVNKKKRRECGMKANVRTTTASATARADAAQIEPWDRWIVWHILMPTSAAGGCWQETPRCCSFICQCKGSCTQLQAIEVVVVMATMPWAIIITMVTVLVLD